MPTYEYQCASCSHALEAFQKISDEPLNECPQCKKNTLQRGIGGGHATFQFKGKGFYITDYKQKPEGPQKAEASSACCPCDKNKGNCSN